MKLAGEAFNICATEQYKWCADSLNNKTTAKKQPSLAMPKSEQPAHSAASLRPGHRPVHWPLLMNVHRGPAVPGGAVSVLVHRPTDNGQEYECEREGVR